MKRLLAAALVATGLPLLVATPAGADEVWSVPASGLPIEGRGYGHGRGMSQYGAQGAALQGVDHRAILDRYYPGTAVGALPAGDSIRVLISQDADGVLEVAGDAGLTVADVNGWSMVLPAEVPRWRFHADTPSGVQLQRLEGSTWVDVSGPMQAPWFQGPSRIKVVLPTGTTVGYRGIVRAVRAGNVVQPVNELSMQDYLRGVVPRESPASFEPEALQAQAVAARTYAAYKRAAGRTPGYDLCSTTACQVYGGSVSWSPGGAFTDLEHPRTNAAIDGTAGEIRTYGGRPALTEFSSSTGGWNTAGGVPYLRAQPDPWDDFPGNPVHAWKATISPAAVQERYPAVGQLRRIRVTGRDGNGEWGGRITSVVLEGVSGSGAPTSVTTTGPALRSALGLRSEWWTVRAGAIQLKWMELGGSSSVVGDPVSGEYAVPGGVAQDFTRGRIYWSPATGAKEVHGGIAQRYLDAGGPGALGLPVSDEEPVRGAVRSRFQRGQIYWTAAAGARVVRGGVLERYLARGGPDGGLGLPVAEEAPHAGGVRAVFTGGRVYWSPGTGAWAVQGAVLARYVALGEAGRLGFPTSDEAAAPGGRFSPFTAGRIYWSEATGAVEVRGGVLEAYLRTGGAGGVLGLPIRAETPAPGGVEARFQRGRVWWSPASGAFEVHGGILDRYLQLGGPGGELGGPVSDEYAVADGARSDFARGSLVWRRATNEVVLVAR